MNKQDILREIYHKVGLSLISMEDYIKKYPECSNSTTDEIFDCLETAKNDIYLLIK